MVAGVPIFSFGAFADVQYADKANSSIESRTQYYKSSVQKLEKSVKHFNTIAGELACVVSLGDVIDGNAASQELTDIDMETVAGVLDSSELPIYHAVGNHCLSVPRARLVKRLGIPHTCYYAKDLAQGWRLVVLDTTELSRHSGYPEGSQQAKETEAYIAGHPADKYPNMSEWNGGITATQLEWLKGQLAQADAEDVRCIVLSHHPIGKGAARETHRAWGADDIEQVLAGSKAVVAAFSGHDHPGGYALVGGVHHVVLEAILEAPEDSNAYAVVRVYDDRLVIQGFGKATSRELPFKKH